MRLPRRRVWFAVILSAAVLGTVVAGLVILGPPAEWRGRSLDAQRASDLRELAFAIHEYWLETGMLPESLDPLAQQRAWIAELCDPATGALYEYRTTGDETYELCAQFSIDTREDARAIALHGFSTHTAGRHCFALHATDATPVPPR